MAKVRLKVEGAQGEGAQDANPLADPPAKLHGEPGVPPPTGLTHDASDSQAERQPISQAQV
eukprot:8027937-Alexandrium_andersonii.AAC.1